MKEDKPISNQLSKLRKQSEKVLRMQPETLQKLSSEEAYRLIHKLGAHLTELERQNIELERQNIELERQNVELNRQNEELHRTQTESEKRLKKLAEGRQVAGDNIECEVELKGQNQLDENLKKYHTHLEELILERSGQLDVTVNALREAEAKYGIVVDQAMDGVAVIQDGAYKFVNKAMTDLSGYSNEELMAQSPYDIVTPEYRSLCLQKQGMLGENIPSSYEVEIQGKDGTVKNVFVSLRGILYNGKMAAVRFIRDVTESRKLEKELQKAERLESIGTLAGGIAHDFRNILTAIVGNLSLAKLYLKPEDQVFELLTEAEKASMRAKDLTHQLLTFSKGGAPVKKTSSILELLKDTAEFALRGSRVRCDFSLPDDLWSAEIDPGQIGQVLNNLIMNAGQAMPKGGIIRLSAKNMLISAEDSLPLKNGNYIKISVEDHGVGIPQEDLRKIFDPYFTTKPTGSGLGLATAYSIIKKHDGYISVESQIDAGTTFSFYLPASPQVIFPDKQERVEKKNLARGQGRILFMEDEEIVRNVAGQMLEYLSYEVEFAQDGTEAIEMYKNRMESGHPFDLVIMDLIIPGGMGGKEAIEKLHEVAPEAKAIVSSGYSSDPILSDYESYGFIGAITKPYAVKELKEILQRIIG